MTQPNQGISFHVEFYQVCLILISLMTLAWAIVKWYLEVSSKRNDARAQESQKILNTIENTLSEIKGGLTIHGEKISNLEKDNGEIKKEQKEIRNLFENHKENILKIVYNNMKNN